MTGGGFGAEEVQPFDDYRPLARLFGWSQRPVLSRVKLGSGSTDDEKALAATASLRPFPEIESVTIEGPAFEDDSLEHLTTLPQLAELTLLGTSITGDGFARFGSSLTVRDVVFERNAISSELIEGLSALPNLELLALIDCRPVKRDAYAAIEHCRRLRTLHVQNSGFCDDDIPALAKLEDIEELTVDGITDAGLARLSSLRAPTMLNLCSPVTSDAAREF